VSQPVSPPPLLWARSDVVFDGTQIFGKLDRVDRREEKTTSRARGALSAPKVWSPQADPNEHYSPSDLAAAWGYSVSTIRRLLEDEDDVIKLTKRNSRKRVYVTKRIPQEVALRVYRKLKKGHR
jgi:hypothetical protein